MFDGQVVGGDDTCEWDKEKVEQHIGNGIYLKVYHNTKEFRLNAFEKQERVQRYAQVSTIFSVPT